MTGTAEKQTKNWLVFGTGAHYCLGQNYATSSLMAMIGKASMEMDWEHTPTPQSEDIKVFATIFPQVCIDLPYDRRRSKALMQLRMTACLHSALVPKLL